jgi:hypothetical protein
VAKVVNFNHGDTFQLARSWPCTAVGAKPKRWRKPTTTLDSDNSHHPAAQDRTPAIALIVVTIVNSVCEVDDLAAIQHNCLSCQRTHGNAAIRSDRLDASLHEYQRSLLDADAKYFQLPPLQCVRSNAYAGNGMDIAA